MSGTNHWGIKIQKFANCWVSVGESAFSALLASVVVSGPAGGGVDVCLGYLGMAL